MILKLLKIGTIILALLLLLCQVILPRVAKLEQLQATAVQQVNQLLLEQLLDGESEVDAKRLVSIKGRASFSFFPLGLKLQKIQLGTLYYRGSSYSVELAKAIVVIPLDKVFSGTDLLQEIKSIMLDGLVITREVASEELPGLKVNVLLGDKDEGGRSSILKSFMPPKLQNIKLHNGGFNRNDVKFVEKANLELSLKSPLYKLTGKMWLRNEDTTVDIWLNHDTRDFDVGLFAPLFSLRLTNQEETESGEAVKTNRDKESYYGTLRFGVLNLQVFLQKMFASGEIDDWTNKILFDGRLNVSSDSFSFRKGMIQISDLKVISSVINATGFATTEKNSLGKLETYIRLHLPNLDVDRLVQGVFNGLSGYGMKKHTIRTATVTNTKTTAVSTDHQTPPGSTPPQAGGDIPSSMVSPVTQPDNVPAPVQVDTALATTPVAETKDELVSSTDVPSDPDSKAIPADTQPLPINPELPVSDDELAAKMTEMEQLDMSSVENLNDADTATTNITDELPVAVPETGMLIINDGNSDNLLGSIIEANDLIFDVSIDELHYMEEPLSNVTIDIRGVRRENDQVFVVRPLSFTDKSGNTYIINGQFEDSGFRGSLFSTGKNLANMLQWFRITSRDRYNKNIWRDYYLLGQFSLQEGDLQFSEAYLKVDGLYAWGRINFKDLGIRPKVDGKIFVRDLDIGRQFFPAVAQKTNRTEVEMVETLESKTLNSLVASMGLDKLYTDLLLLNNFWIETALQVRMINGHFDQYAKFADAEFLFKSSEGYFGIEQLRFDNPQQKSVELDRSASFTVNIKTEVPEIKVNLDFNSVDINHPNSVADIQLFFNDDIYHFNTLFFAMPVLREIGGRLDMNLGEVNIGEHFNLRNLQTAGSEILGGGVIFPDLSATVFGGKLKADLSLSFLEKKSMVTSFSGEEAKIRQFLQWLGLNNAQNFQGSMSISGILRTSGNNFQEFSDNLDLTFKIASNDLALKAFGLNDLVSKTFYPVENKVALQDLDKFFFAAHRGTAFTKMLGVIRKKTTEPKINFKFTTQNQLYNTVTQGIMEPNYDALSRSKLDLTSNMVFVTGTKSKATSLRIAAKKAGLFYNNRTVANFSQVNTYLIYMWQAARIAEALMLPQVEEVQDNPEDFKDEITPEVESTKEGTEAGEVVETPGTKEGEETEEVTTTVESIDGVGIGENAKTTESIENVGTGENIETPATHTNTGSGDITETVEAVEPPASSDTIGGMDEQTLTSTEPAIVSDTADEVARQTSVSPTAIPTDTTTNGATNGIVVPVTDPNRFALKAEVDTVNGNGVGGSAMVETPDNSSEENTKVELDGQVKIDANSSIENNDDTAASIVTPVMNGDESKDSQPLSTDTLSTNSDA